MFPTEYPEFITVTCLDWKFLLSGDHRKFIIANSLRFLVDNGRVIVYGFVIMTNHFHVVWQFTGSHEGYAVIRDFLKFTSQQLLTVLAVEDPILYNELQINASDRTYQVWQRDSLRIPLWSDKVFNQKLNYVHWNPVKAGLCNYPDEYRFSSASFYLTNESEWEFLTHPND